MNCKDYEPCDQCECCGCDGGGTKPSGTMTYNGYDVICNLS